MSKISKALRMELDAYATKIDLRQDIAMYCLNMEEIDAAKKADTLVASYAMQYSHAKHVASHDGSRTQKKLLKDLDAAKEEGERQTTKSKSDALAPVASEIKLIKQEALAVATSYLADAGISDKRIERIIPRLTDTLSDEEEIYDNYK